MASETDRSDHDDEVLEAGARTSRLSARLAAVRMAHPRATRALIVGATVVVAAVVVASGLVSNGGSKRPSQLPSSSHVDPPPHPPSARVVALLEVWSMTEHTVPLRDYVRQTFAAGACAQVRPGRSPVSAIEDVLSSAVPHFHVTDVGRTLDQFADLCALQLRATGPGGSVLGLVVASPPAGSHAAPYVRTVHDAGPPDVTFVQLRDRDGWTVLLGVTRTGDRAPSSKILRGIATDAKLTW